MKCEVLTVYRNRKCTTEAQKFKEKTLKKTQLCTNFTNDFFFAPGSGFYIVLVQAWPKEGYFDKVNGK